MILLSLIPRSEALKAFNGNEGIPFSSVIDSQRLIEDVRYLSSDELKGREAGTNESIVARDYVTKRFKQSGIEFLEKDYIQEFSFKDGRNNTIQAANVVGLIKGNSEPGKFIVISAHYDHLGTRNGQIYNGADDNASGTAALFAVAKYFNDNSPNYSLIFAAFDAEEKGSPGAVHFLRNMPQNGENIVLNINLDMISRSDKNELYAAGTYHYPAWKKYLVRLKGAAPVTLLFGHDRPELKTDDWTTQSDHRIFHQNNIPFIYFGVEDHDDYHKPTDDFDRIQPQFYINAVETILMAVKSIDANYKKH